MKTFWFQIIGLFILIMGATFLAFNQEYLTPLAKLFNTSDKTQEVSLEKKNVLKILGPDGSVKSQLDVEIANDSEKRSKGLGGRASLATDSGMLFIHSETSLLTYWMKGMEFPIDFFWIKDDTIIDIIPNAVPPVKGQKDDTLVRYTPVSPVNKVLETNSGFASKFNIQKGDKIVLESK